jgi:serine/threonine-protein phosphatase PPG1
MGFDVDRYLELAWTGKLIDKDVIKVLTMKVQELLIAEPNVVHISAPVAIVGDIHGQFYDLLELFKVSGRPPGAPFLFLGDYVDRGNHSVEVITLICLLKLKYPRRVYMIRGNHETRTTNTHYGFYAECKEKFGEESQTWQNFNSVFDYLPMAAIISNQLFCVHGGLSPKIETIDDINAINRFEEITPEGPLVDLMWSDPREDNFTGFAPSERKAGFDFGKDMVEAFLKVNNLSKVIRAHQMCQNGYMQIFDEKFITVWSAPNYMYRFKNKASCLEVDENLEMYFNLFTWSKENEDYRQDLMMAEKENRTNFFFK